MGVRGTYDCLYVLITVTAFLKNIGKYIASLQYALLFLHHFKRVCSETHQLWTFCKLSLVNDVTLGNTLCNVLKCPVNHSTEQTV